jgi:hypothetical protein
MPGLIDKRYARLILNNDALDETYDELLDLLIDSYSEAVVEYTERQFTPDDDTTYLFRHSGRGSLDLRPYELRSATEISYSPEGYDPVLLAADQWRGEPRNKSRWGTYLWLSAPIVTATAVPYFPYQSWSAITVSITGDWGMTEVPSNVKLAVAACVDNYFRNSTGVQSQSLGALSFAEEPKTEEGLEICGAARRLLRPFVRY